MREQQERKLRALKALVDRLYDEINVIESELAECSANRNGSTEVVAAIG